MGFPSPSHDLVIPNFVLQVFYLLGFLRDLISSIFRLLGLTHLLEYDLPQPSDASDQIQRRGSQSLSAMLIRETLPDVHFRDLCKEKAMDGCVICLCEYEEGEEIKRLRNCEHLFHRGCLDRWMECEQVTCPLCRSHLVPEEMRQEFKEKLWAAEEALYLESDDLSMWHEQSRPM